MKTSFLVLALVFLGGFIIMVIEIAGARFLTTEFGGSFYVWVSQIGVVMLALAAGYYTGGMLADRWRGLRWIACLLVGAGIALALVPSYGPPLLQKIVLRHPAEVAVPLIWQKLDPAFGSAVVFLFPCWVLAMLPPCCIRFGASGTENLGRLSGAIIAWSTVGSIAGVFAAGYLLLDLLKLSTVFRTMGGLTALLGALCWRWERKTGFLSGKGACRG